MLRESESTSIHKANAKRGSRLPHGAMDCTPIHVRAARGIWPKKTAENWAAKAGVKPRMAKYWLSGKKPVSASGRLALMRELG